MGRALRIVDPDSIYHVTVRGNNRGAIAWDGHDGDTFVEELDLAARRYRWDVFAWCLMPNHYHLALRAPEDGFSAGFRELNGNYSRRTNRRHERSDHLFRNRFRWKRVSSDAHLIAVLLYVVRNPVEAGLATHASEWRHSSYRATAGRAPAPPWLAVDQVLRLFGSTPDEARAAYEQTVRSGQFVVSDTDSERRPQAPLALTI